MHEREREIEREEQDANTLVQLSDRLRALIPRRIKSPLKALIFSSRRMTSGLRLMPDFLVIGAARSGTTSLYRYLARHPAIAPASTKEIHYFSIHHWRGIEWYKAHFPTAMTRGIRTWRGGVRSQTGEATPYYLFHPLAAERIAEALPDIKLVVLLRNPIERAFSHYLHEVNLGIEELPFEQAIEEEQRRLDGEVERIASDPRYPGFRYQHFSYLSRGIYCDQLVRWFSFFSREQFLILESDRFWADPSGSHAAVLRFLGLPAISLTTYPQHNKSEPSKMSSRTKEQLLDYFTPHNERLYSLLGSELGWELQ
jgi:Sulfotransferase domain